MARGPLTAYPPAPEYMAVGKDIDHLAAREQVDTIASDMVEMILVRFPVDLVKAQQHDCHEIKHRARGGERHSQPVDNDRLDKLRL
eukprot:CAMPEP_0182836982 /NCGR_PEP_ID=MMETSP0006_2-20121128/22419_1 /TAXON_ID=97485 /ORGANISM="Prymnesium parvum, Strain Texoma1" /LENGTH=85 /DNA_ID=CAMNT_0024965693 /DNA_START=36 /DNA_END=291 /DNA_ORIENTATION=+